MSASLSELLDLLAAGPIALWAVGVIPTSSAAIASGTDAIAKSGHLAVDVPSSFIGVLDHLADLDRLITVDASTNVLGLHGGRS